MLDKTALLSLLSNASEEALARKSPLLRILKINWSPSSPYFPVSVDRFSKEGV